MKAIEFPQQTVVLAKDQDQYNNLPVFISDDQERQMISCHQLDENELKIIQETKKIWMGQLTFGNPYQPSFVTVVDPWREYPEEKLKYLSITKAAANYGRILKCEWLNLRQEWEPKEMKVNSTFLKAMENGNIKNVEVI